MSQDKKLLRLARSRKWKQENKEKVAEYMKTWRENNRDKIRINKKVWDMANPDRRKKNQEIFKTKNPDYYKRKHLEYTYGMPLEVYDEILESQGERCLVCNVHVEETPRKRLFVDHSHATGKIRGLLCQHCNSALGMVKEDTSILQSLIAYLNEHR